VQHTIELPEKISCAKGGNSMSVIIDITKNIPQVDLIIEFYLGGGFESLGLILSGVTKIQLSIN